MSEWRTIDTAPQDGSRILGFGSMDTTDQSIATIRWNRTYGVWNCDPNEASEYDPEPCNVTHWMPLPEAPQ